MPISLLSNPAAFSARRHLEENSEALARASERVSTGKRINKPSDDAAGLAIGSTLEADIRSIAQARRNSTEALSFVQVAEGGMNEVSNLLVRLRELAVQSASDTLGDKERQLIQLEAGSINEEMQRLADSTRYFGTHLLNGTGKEFIFQIGIDNEETSRISFETGKVDLRPGSLGVDGLDLSSRDSALDALQSIDDGLGKLAIPTAQLGGLQTRLNSVNNQLMLYEENMTNARSRIVDADLAKETTELVRTQIQQKAATSVLAQANTFPMLALRLIEGS